MGGGAIRLAGIYQVPILPGRRARESGASLCVVVGIREELNVLPHDVGESLKRMDIDSTPATLDVREPVFLAGDAPGEFLLGQAKALASGS